MPDLPPGSQPLPPMPPSPAYYPPPPAKKSGVLKWVLIGCGTLAGLGVLLCGGLILWGVLIGKSATEVHAECEKRIRNSAIVQEELGPVKKVTWVQQQNQPQSGTPKFSYQVQGEKASGVVEATLTFNMLGFKIGNMVLTTEDDRVIQLEEPPQR